MIRKDSKENEGIRLLVKKYRAMFEIPENLNHYSEADYKVAEKKFFKYAILEDKVRNLGDILYSPCQEENEGHLISTS